jgi:hypothetical protein
MSSHLNNEKMVRDKNGTTFSVQTNFDDWGDACEENSSKEQSSTNKKYVKRKTKQRTKKDKCTMNESSTIKPKNEIIEKRTEDYYTAFRREVSTELRNISINGMPKPIRNSRWNKKYQREIEDDKRIVYSWFESGMDGPARAPKYVERGPDDDGIDPTSFKAMPKSKPITLGDYFPSFSALGNDVPSFERRPDNIDHPDVCQIFEPRESNHNSDSEGLKSTFEVLQLTDKEVHDNFHTELKREIESTIAQVDGGNTDDDLSDSTEKPESLLHSKVLKAIECEKQMSALKQRVDQYEKCVTALAQVRAAAASLMADESCEPEKDDQNSEKLPCEICKDLVEERQIGYRRVAMLLCEFCKNNSDKEGSPKVPLCVHGVRYQLMRFTINAFNEAELIMKIMPRKQLKKFSKAVRMLLSAMEVLRYDYTYRKTSECSQTYCRWVNFETSDDSSYEYSLISKKIPCSISFEIKLVELSSNKYWLKSILKDSDDFPEISKSSDIYLGIKYRKALEALEFHKSKNFCDNMDRFQDTIYKEIFPLLHFLTQEEEADMYEKLVEFQGIINKMKEVENKTVQRGLPKCTRTRPRRIPRVTCDTCESSLCSDNEHEPENKKPDQSQSETAEVIQAPDQFQSEKVEHLLCVPNQFSAEKVKNITIKPEQLPTVMVEYISPVYKYSEENIVSQDPDPCNTNKEEKQNSPSSLSSSENNSGFANTKINYNHD